MIDDRPLCQQMILRFSGLPGYPKSDRGVSELIDAAQRAFHAEHELRKVTEDLIRGSRRCPVPADFYEAGAKMHTYGTYRPPRCTVCYDDPRHGPLGWFLVTWEGQAMSRQPISEEKAMELREKLACGKQGVYQAPVRCECRNVRPPERERAA